MQLIESSFSGLRSARHQFSHPETGAQVTLFPMIHVGEAEFYDAVYADALGHDVVLAEGVASPIVTRLTRSYRWVENSGLGLICQPKLRQAADYRGRLVRADLTRTEFETAWRGLPVTTRAFMAVLSPFVGLKRRFTRSREALSKRMNLTLLEDRDEILGFNDETAGLHRVIVTKRDERLIECLQAELAALHDKRPKIAIVYGAFHMRAVIRKLLEEGFTLTGSDWMTVYRHL